jgi:hypothetical protein
MPVKISERLEVGRRHLDISGGKGCAGSLKTANGGPAYKSLELCLHAGAAIFDC